MTASARRRLFVEPRRSAVRALALMAFLTGAAGEPTLGSSQERPESPYRILQPRSEGPHPAVLFVSGCSGFAPHEAPDHYPRTARDFVARGFVVVFVDYLGARGRQVCGGVIHPGDVVGDILAAAEYARTRPFIQPSDISVIGWSMGGGGALAAIGALPGDRPAPFQRVVAYYPACYGVGTPWHAKVPVLMLLGGQDDLSPPGVCQRLVERLGGDLPIEIRLYATARHAFDVPELPPLLRWRGGTTLGYDPNAAAAAREEVKRFLGR